jgi:hypothetical protein
MKEDIGLVILEHLSHELNIHILDIDLLVLLLVLLRVTLARGGNYLETFIQKHDRFVQFLLRVFSH